MLHEATSRFWESLRALPTEIQSLAKKNFDLLKENPKHPSLHFKKIGQFYSVRIGKVYRALAIKDNERFVWVWIGHHKEYDRLIKQK